MTGSSTQAMEAPDSRISWVKLSFEKTLPTGVRYSTKVDSPSARITRSTFVRSAL